MILLYIVWGGIAVFLLWLFVAYFEYKHHVKIINLLLAKTETKREIENIQSEMGLTTSYGFLASDLYELINKYFKLYKVTSQYMNLTYIDPKSRVFYMARHIIILACKDTMYMRAYGKNTSQTSMLALTSICNLYLFCGKELLDHRLIDKSLYTDMMDYVKQINELKYSSLY